MTVDLLVRVSPCLAMFFREGSDTPHYYFNSKLRKLDNDAFRSHALEAVQ